MNLQAVKYHAALPFSEAILLVVAVKHDSVSTKRRNIADWDVGPHPGENCDLCRIAGCLTMGRR